MQLTAAPPYTLSSHVIVIDAVAKLSSVRVVPDDVAIPTANPSPLLAVIPNAATRLTAAPSEDDGGQDVDNIPKEDDVAT
jgi:hypothetical protein